MSEYEVYSYKAFRRRIREEMRIVPECGIDMLEEVVNFVRKNMRTKTIVGDNGKRSDKDEYPIIAVREAVLNALIHRDYSMLTENTPITIEMYRNRMEVVSKGGLYGDSTASDRERKTCYDNS